MNMSGTGSASQRGTSHHPADIAETKYRRERRLLVAIIVGGLLLGGVLVCGGVAVLNAGGGIPAASPIEAGTGGVLLLALLFVGSLVCPALALLRHPETIWADLLPLVPIALGAINVALAAGGDGAVRDLCLGAGAYCVSSGAVMLARGPE